MKGAATNIFLQSVHLHCKQCIEKWLAHQKNINYVVLDGKKLSNGKYVIICVCFRILRWKKLFNCWLEFEFIIRIPTLLFASVGVGGLLNECLKIGSIRFDGIWVEILLWLLELRIWWCDDQVGKSIVMINVNVGGTWRLFTGGYVNSTLQLPE